MGQKISRPDKEKIEKRAEDMIFSSRTIEFLV